MMRISQQLHLGAGEHRGGLSVYPIWQPGHSRLPVRLADPLSVTVRELDNPMVGRLEVTAAGLPVLLLEGDVLVGGQQDRMVVDSAVLAPGTRAEIEVRCVEKERWHGNREHVPGSRRATSFIRGDFDQLGVWSRVAQESERSAPAPRVDDLQMLPGQCGVLIGIGGKPRLVELFADQELLGQAWRRILDAAAREAAGVPSVHTTGHNAREFIRCVAALKPVVTSSSGIGHAVAVTRGSLELRGTTLDSDLLHASVLDLVGAA